MLGNNPMGTRRRRRFYHRIGVVPVVHPIELTKEDLTFANFELAPFDYTEQELFHPITNVTPGGKRCVNFITVTSLHARLMEIIDAMIALAEAEERASDANNQGTEKKSSKNTEKDLGSSVDESAPKTESE